jgi:hypothetical protein
MPSRELGFNKPNSTIQKQAAQSGFPQAEAMLTKLPDGFEEATGLKWEKVLGSLGGEFGFAVSHP